ncbi:hypothetical protein BLI708_08690 [Bifidobacterium imperatoris]|uniref:Uncharacterized protein n=2 Tax=Bifidobacterium imperatoris TaxID=2020965 RepID=A0ABX7RZY6_9BIFI|nr:hypothetical protein [Bifidobacterium imperatoris]QSY57305.1 hypothetical protein BLI708_08690 [Bifidobacterium imperatoris]
MSAVKWTRHSTMPTGFLVTRMKHPNEDDASVLHVLPTLWDLRSTEAWVRFRNTLTDTWATNHIVKFTWLAWW